MQRTTGGRLAAEVAFVIVGVGVVALSAGTVSKLLLVDRFHAHYVLALLTAGIGAAAVGLGHTAGRIAGNRRAAWLIPALALYCLVVVPGTPMPPTHQVDATSSNPGLLVGCIAVAALLLAAVRPPARARDGAGWLVAGAAALLTIGLDQVTRMFPEAGAAMTAPAALDTVVLVGWWTVSTVVAVAGFRAASPPLWRVGLGFGVIALAHLYRTLRTNALAEPSLVFASLRLLGVVVVLLGMAQLLRRALNGVLNDWFDRDEDRRIAGIEVERSARSEAERLHELSNGLTALAGVTHLLTEGSGSERDVRARAAAAAEVRRLADLINDRPRSPAPARYCVGEVVEELVALWRVSGMDVEATITPGLMAVGRRSVLAQVLTNVLANCGRHAAGSAVRIVTKQVGDKVVVQVRDNGPGMPPPGSEPAVTAGQGIGISLSRQLLNVEGGDLRVHSFDPRSPGCTVSIELVAGASSDAEPSVPVARPNYLPVEAGQVR